MGFLETASKITPELAEYVEAIVRKWNSFSEATTR